MILITGNTYPVKDRLRELGGKWDGDRKGWLVPDDKADEAQAIVAAAPVKAPRRSRYGSNYARFSGGGEVYTNKKGRCEDAPCCGCCS